VEPAESPDYFPPNITGTMSCGQAATFVPPPAYYDNVGSTTYAEAAANFQRVDIPDNCETWGSVEGIITERPDGCGGEMIILYTFPEYCGIPVVTAAISVLVDPGPEAFILGPEILPISCSEAATFTPPDAIYSSDPDDYFLLEGEENLNIAVEEIHRDCFIKGSISGQVIGTPPGVCGGFIDVLYSGQDACGRDLPERIISVAVLPAIDPEWPDAPGNIEVRCDDLPKDGDGNPFWPASELDYSNGESGICKFTGSSISTISGDIDCCGSTLIETWTAETCAGSNPRRSSEVVFYSREITIIPDDIGPNLHGIPQDVTIECADELPPWPTVTATDNLDDIVEVNRREVPGFARCGGNFFERIFTAVDACGNEHSAKYTIHIQDNVKPELTVPEDLILQCGDTIPEPTHTVIDNCSQTEVDFSEIRTDHNACDYTLLRTWRATDACGNEVEKTQTIILIDEESPKIILINPMLAGLENGGDLIMYGCDAPQALMTDVLVTDNCCGPKPASLVVADVNVGSNHCDVFDFHERWRCDYTATDPVGNVSNFHFYVLLYDTTAPVISNIPPEVKIDSLSLVPPFDTAVTAHDDCIGDLPVSIASSIIHHPDNFDQQMISRSWSAEDACGNFAGASQQILINGFDPNLMTSAIGDRVWHDVNLNGQQDPDEEGLNNIKLNLYRFDVVSDAMVLYDTAVTASENEAEGIFLFDQLFPGRYQVEIVPGEGMTLTNQGEAADTIDSDASAETNMTDVIQLDSQMVLSDIDFGLHNVAIGNEETPVGKSNIRVAVYPNPFSEEFAIDFGENWMQFKAGKVVNKLGRVISQFSKSEIVGSVHQIELPDLSPGHYFVQLQFEKTTVVKRVVKI